MALWEKMSWMEPAKEDQLRGVVGLGLTSSFLLMGLGLMGSSMDDDGAGLYLVDGWMVWCGVGLG